MSFCGQGGINRKCVRPRFSRSLIGIDDQPSSSPAPSVSMPSVVRRADFHARGCPLAQRVSLTRTAIPPDTKSRESQRCIADDLMNAARVTARCHVIKCGQWSGTQPANEPGLPFYLFGDHGPTAGYGIPLPSALSTRQLLPYGRWKLHLEVWASELPAWCYRHSALDPVFEGYPWLRAFLPVLQYGGPLRAKPYIYCPEHNKLLGARLIGHNKENCMKIFLGVAVIGVA